MAVAVLIVDDSLQIRTVLQHFLCNGKMRVATVHQACDGEEALQLLPSLKISLILADIAMPRMDGLTLLAKLKSSSDWAAIPVVMMTGDDAHVMAAMKLGAAGYVQKPFSKSQLEEKLALILGGPLS
jgi:CheY-like chemotaxis protein